MAAPYTVSLDADEARRLAEKGGTLLLLDVPDGTSFGIDQQMFVTGPRFKGVKMLPPGPHFGYYSAAGKHGGAAPIIGFFVVLKQGQVVVRQWDAREERLAPLNDEDQEERLAGGVRTFQFDSGLGAYDLHRYAAWQSLSNYITEAVVKAHEPVGGDICVVCEADVGESRPKTGAEKKLQEQIQRGRARGQPAAVATSTDADGSNPNGRGNESGHGRASTKDVGLGDVTRGVIIMDQGEDEEAAAEALGGEPLVSGSGSGSGSVSRKYENGNGKGDQMGNGNDDGNGKSNSDRNGDGTGIGNRKGNGNGNGTGTGFALSKADQIALMYQRKEAREGTDTQSAEVDPSQAEAMDVDPKDDSREDAEKRQAAEQRERRDFAGLRGDGFLPGSAQPGQSGSVHSAAPQSLSTEEERPGRSTGQGDAGAEASSSGRQKRGGSGRCFYMELPRLVKRPGISPSELTALNLDKSGLLEAVLRKQYKGREELLLGEMQFAFIAFVMGQSLESFAQWKAVLHLMLGCVDAPLRSRTRLFVWFLRALYWQLRHGLLPGASRGAGDALLDEAWFEKDNFLQHLLTGFFSVLREAQPIDGDLKQQADLLQNFLEGSLGWRLNGTGEGASKDEDDEYAPTVVY